jgi:hypothetical protein
MSDFKKGAFSVAAKAGPPPCPFSHFIPAHTRRIRILLPGMVTLTTDTMIKHNFVAHLFT